MATKVNTQGFDVSNTTVYSKNVPLKPAELDTLTCPACKKVLREPVQVIACGHRFCKGCISALTSERWGVYTFSCWNMSYTTCKYRLLVKNITLLFFSTFQWRSVQLSCWWGVIWSNWGEFVWCYGCLETDDGLQYGSAKITVVVLGVLDSLAIATS